MDFITIITNFSGLGGIDVVLGQYSKYYHSLIFRFRRIFSFDEHHPEGAKDDLINWQDLPYLFYISSLFISVVKLVMLTLDVMLSFFCT